jgi:23S rRNA pseudouridine2605 synthase
MRINKFVARATGMSRRAADAAISEGRITINLRPAAKGSAAGGSDTVRLDSKVLELPAAATTVMLNKPAGYVCSRDGQGSRTIYDLLPADLHHLKPVGRLDKDSSGLILLTDDGELANRLTHPRYAKEKIYEIKLDKPLSDEHKKRIGAGVELDDGPSRLKIDRMKGPSLRVSMSEGRNRQIRRTFAALGYEVRALHRTAFGPYDLGTCSRGRHRILYTDD